MNGTPISSAPLDSLYRDLSTTPGGLPEAIADARVKEQAAYFKKESRFKREFRLFIRQFSNPLVLLLVIAVILSAVLGESSDSIIILVILLSTCVFGFIQEANAGRAMEKLRALIEMKHTVLRDGKMVQLATHEVVAGDILLLEAGDTIPADSRIVESNELHVNESSLTGESFPVEKQTGVAAEELPLAKKFNCLWQGTNVISGTAKALAVRTGDQTFYGQMAHSLGRTPETSFEKGIRRFGYFLLRTTLVLCIIILAINLYFKRPLFDSVLFSLALAIGMSPELLPAIMTFAMASGAKRMLKKKVIVKKLSSIFNFGEVNILCTDKTGTITEGVATVKDIVDAEGKPGEEQKLYAFLNASFQNGFNNPIDDALIALKLSTSGYVKINEIPYDFVRRRLSVAVKNEKGKLIITKGAFDSVLEVCSKLRLGNGESVDITEERLVILRQQYIKWGQEGCRVLGLAVRSFDQEKISRVDEHDMTFLGYILLQDPLKESARESIKRLQSQFIGVRIISGDNRYAALQSARGIGFESDKVLTGEDISSLSPEALIIKVRETEVFAEIEPQQKEMIIRAFQKAGAIVAYMGDGINDVAAINAADIGISTNNAVDVAKDAADFVLLEKDLSVLADGVYEGRRSFVNSMKYIFITTGATFGNMFSVAAASIFLPFLPMLPKQILLTNLVSDMPFLAIASDHVDESQLTRPGKWDLRLIRNFMTVFGIHSSLFDFITFYVLFVYFRFTGSLFQTGWFVESVLTELIILFVIRTRKPFMRSTPGKWLLLTALAAGIITILLPFSPLAGVLGFKMAGSREVIAILFILIAYLLTADLLKIIFFRLSSRRN